MSTLVRYVTSSSGARVRENPGSNIVLATLASGELMYDHVGVSRVTAALNGVNHVWIKIHYYHINNDNSTAEGDGWIAEDVVAFVPTALPAKSTINSTNISKQEKRLKHARYIYDYLYSCGWTPNAIFATLGNLEIESKLNPSETNSENGAYGLPQWYPSDKLTSTLQPGESASDVDVQLRKLNHDRYDTSSGAQWRKGNMTTEMSYESYEHSTKSISILAEYFMKCYEVVFDSSLSKRQSSANKWCSLISKIY